MPVSGVTAPAPDCTAVRVKEPAMVWQRKKEPTTDDAPSANHSPLGAIVSLTRLPKMTASATVWMKLMAPMSADAPASAATDCSDAMGQAGAGSAAGMAPRS